MANERLRAVLARDGWTLRDFAEAVAVDPKTVERWITKERTPQLPQRPSATVLPLATDRKIKPGVRQRSASITGMDAETAARRWADTWSHAWPQRDVEAIAVLYADTAVHHTTPFREPGLGRAGVRRYLTDNFLVETDIECWFGPPIASGGRAAVEWWASWTEQGQELTYAGVSVLRFDDQGQVVEHRDYDHHIERRQRPYPDW